MKRQLEMLAAQAAQLAADRAPKKQEAPVAPPQGMDAGFYNAMVSAGAAPHAPAPAIPALSGPQQATPLPPPPAPGPLPMLPPVGAPIQQAPQQAPLMSQMSPAPQAPALANINNNVTMPTQTFTPAQQRPNLPTFQNASLIPHLGGYAPPPSMPGYGMPRTGQPFRPAAPPQGLPTFAAFGGQAQTPQPYGSPQPDMGLNLADRRFNLFQQFQ